MFNLYDYSIDKYRSEKAQHVPHSLIVIILCVIKGRILQAKLNQATRNFGKTTANFIYHFTLGILFCFFFCTIFWKTSKNGREARAFWSRKKPDRWQKREKRKNKSIK